ncbi:MAG: carbamoyl-phosphate synthase large subunit [Candidatus Dadabacteria bacterium]|nr:carbamoyl-phosphate synthase large subunit [Candidatus Dadabacteria bacterium]TDJ03078.1 MAG: carbamoyl-phosphate synthase large subunit [Candidatus Dadabacteria bacterium]
MPKRTDIETILIIGSGPIVIGQACEFDYSGTQACKALKEEGYRIVLVNSNPATIMTDPTFADRTYIEPIHPDIVEKIIEKERPQALLPTLGGQTALNIAVDLAESGVLDKYEVELIGAKLHAIKKAENRELFKDAMIKIGLKVPRSGIAHSMEEAWKVVEEIGYPVIIRPSFTLGGAGGSVAYNKEEYKEFAKSGLDLSPSTEILVEQSVFGWKEYELEVMRDTADNVVIICSIENFDPMGVHTGDSITVVPSQTLTDKEYQRMRDASIAIIREIGVDTGGSNIQFGLNPEDGTMVVIEMNPRVSRSSALASKATGFPIAKIAAKLAVGYTLDEISNDITRYTPASFEPTIDYVVTKIPRFTFEKFPQTDHTLTTQMKSVGEVMAIGRTFKESLQKALRSLEIDSWGFESITQDTELIREKLRTPNSERLWYVADAFRAGMDIEEIFNLTYIDRWFLQNLKQILDLESRLKETDGQVGFDLLKLAKEYGFSDIRIGELLGKAEDEVRALRQKGNIKSVYKMVDTCAAEFEAYTPYLYSTYEMEDEAPPTKKKKVMILGGGPNRIGQGIEFDYCCVHAAYSLKEEGFESIMVNCNPETVSTDYDTSDRLYFEPITLEDILSIIDRENPWGVIVHLGGQTPLKLAIPLEKHGVNIIGTSPDSIDLAEDRERFRDLVLKLGLKQPQSGIARSQEEAFQIAKDIGYPIVVRPSYVLGGRAMEIVYKEEALKRYITEAVRVSPNHPILIDKFLKDAKEIDVDAICDGKTVVVGGVLEHIEEAGVHSGDSAMVLPPFSIENLVIEEIKRQTKKLALALSIKGLVNIQFAVKDWEVYIIEVNPRASRTIPFVSKAIGVPLAKLGTKVMIGKTLDELGFTQEIVPNHICVKESVFPFVKFQGVDTILGPEMKSTGEVMGIDTDIRRAFAKSQIAAGNELPLSGTAFISVKDDDKPQAYLIAKKLSELGFNIMATRGTSAYFENSGLNCKFVKKVSEGRPHVVDHIKNGEIQLVINTTFGENEVAQSYSIRRTSIIHRLPYFTTIAASRAAAGAIEVMIKEGLDVKAIQDYY